MSNRIAVSRGIRVGTAGAPVGGNDAVRVAGDVLIQKDRFRGLLDDLARRADARSTRLVAVEYGIHLALVRFKILHLLLKFRPVRRSWLPLQGSRHVVAGLVARALIVVDPDVFVVDHLMVV